MFRAGAFYIAATWALAQGIAQLGPAAGLPDWTTRPRPWDATDLQIGLAPTSDGDGAMLGLVLVYAAILVVAVATILWKTLA